MEEKVGLIKDIECKFVKTDPELIDKIVERTGIDAETVKAMMRYNVFTIKQFSVMSKLSISYILNKTRPSVIDGNVGTELDYCFPFSGKGSDGPKFIFRNSKAIKLLES